MPFYNSKNNYSNFSISFSKSPKNDFGIFGHGYYKAASKLAEDFMAQNHFSDNEAYPIVFLYRHSFELYIKNIIYSSILLSAFKGLDDIDQKLYDHHKLGPLAIIAAKILKRIFPHDNELITVSENMVVIAKEFDEIDKDSYSYRYPIDTVGNSSTTRNQIANMESLSQTMNKLLEELNAVDFGLGIETDIAQEVYEMIESIK